MLIFFYKRVPWGNVTSTNKTEYMLVYYIKAIDSIVVVKRGRVRR